MDVAGRMGLESESWPITVRICRLKDFAITQGTVLLPIEECFRPAKCIGTTLPDYYKISISINIL